VLLRRQTNLFHVRDGDVNHSISVTVCHGVRCVVVTKVKTRVVRKTLNPVFDETFTFYGIDANQLTGISLHFVVLSFDRFSRDDVIGEVVYQLEGMEIDSSNKTAVCVCRQIEQRHLKVRLINDY